MISSTSSESAGFSIPTFMPSWMLLGSPENCRWWAKRSSLPSCGSMKPKPRGGFSRFFDDKPLRLETPDKTHWIDFYMIFAEKCVTWKYSGWHFCPNSSFYLLDIYFNVDGDTVIAVDGDNKNHPNWVQRYTKQEMFAPFRNPKRETTPPCPYYSLLGKIKFLPVGMFLIAKSGKGFLMI